MELCFSENGVLCRTWHISWIYKEIRTKLKSSVLVGGEGLCVCICTYKYIYFLKNVKVLVVVDIEFQKWCFFYISVSFLMLLVLTTYQDGTCLAATTSYWKLASKMETCQNRFVAKICSLGTPVNSLCCFYWPFLIYLFFLFDFRLLFMHCSALIM